jgi:hypothetical protein
MVERAIPDIALRVKGRSWSAGVRDFGYGSIPAVRVAAGWADKLTYLKVPFETLAHLEFERRYDRTIGR